MSKKSKPSKTTAIKIETRKVATRRTRMIALEPRMLFDGALGLDLGTKATAVVLGDASQASSAPPDNLAPASPESTRDANPASPAAPKDTSTAVVAVAQTAQSASATPAEKDALQKPGAEALDAASKPVEPKELVFVDSRVKDYQSLLAGVDPKATIVFLDASKDGVTQIADAMANTSGITAVHIIAEGTADQLLLGSGTLDASSMTGLGAQRLSSISDHITADAKILVHDAAFGQGSAGAAVADRLALLTSADVADVASDGTIESVGTPARQEIVFVDPNVADFQTLVNGIDNPNARVVLLDDSQDGVQQILDVVQQYTRVDAIHIISHGSEGQIDLAAGALNSTTIAGEYAAQLAEIGKHLGPDADVMIYGCNFGKGDDGALAAQQLAQVTGAEVAASVDDTGDAALGGNWNLERQTGKIDTGIVIDASARDAYHDVLALHTLDFDTVGNWTAGSNTMTYTVDGYPVTVTVSPAVSGTPALSNSYTGGQSPAQNALQFTLGATGSNTITIDFSGQPGGVVSNVGFALWDVDNTEQAVFSATKADGSTISPTQVADSAFNTITAGTPGTGTSVTVKGTGTDSTAAQANGNVYVYFNTTDLKSVSFTYTGTANTTLVVLNDITFMGNQQNPPIVDLDASTGVIGTAADGFPAAAYTGTTGTIPWNGAWTETDSTGAGATAGQVQVVDTPAAGVNYALRVNNSSASAFTGAQRAIDLSSYSSLTLSYNYMTSTGLSAADQYVLEISTNGGANWTMLKSYGGSSAGAATNTYTADSVSLAGYESANTVIRFRASGTGAFTGAAEYFYIDDVQITASDTSSSNAYTEGDNTGVRIAATANALITDPDSTNMSSVKVQINNVAAGDVLTWTNTGSITGAYNSATGILQLSGVDSKANYQTVIDSILYKNTGDDPTLGGARPTVTVGVTATDSGFDEGNTAVSTITITGVNDAPTLTATASNPTFKEAAGLGTQAAAVGVFSGAAVSTIETGQTVTELDFTVGGVVDGANEKITVDGTAITLGANSSGTTATNAMGYTVTVSGGIATVVLTKAGGISTANAQTLVNGITYQDTITDNPTPGNRVFTLTQVKDSGGTANGGVDSSALAIASTVSVVSVNDAPAGANKTISLPNNATYTFTLADFGFSDVDGNALQSVIITSLPGGAATVKDNGVTLGAGAVVTAADIVAGKLQYVADANNRTFTFQVQDDGGTANSGQNTDQSANTFTMNTPANNTAPVWNAAASNFTAITEAQTANAGQLVSSFMGTVTDPDAGAVNGIAITAAAQTNGTWQYSVDGGTTWTNVNAVTNTSALLLRSTDMVRFAPNGFGSTSSITYRAWDETSGITGTKVDTSTNGTTTAFSTTTHTSSIAVSDVAPTITSSTTATVVEGTSIATTVYTASATDWETVTFSLSGADASAFNINSSTGVVTFKAIPDYETKTTYNFNVVASDATLTSNQAVTINVTDVAPTISSSTTATVAEGTSTATVVYTAAATDVAGGTVTYALTGADAASFNINSATGAVTFVSSPDFETKSSYSINIKASDPSGAFNTQAVTVNVTDVAPTISSSTTATVAEGTSTATVVYTAAATDVNGGAVTYALTGTDAASFNINSATGAVTFVSSPDFETKSSYSINVKASDPSGAFNTQAVTVNVTDVAPTISSSTTATVAEGTSTATVVYTAAATDVNGGTVTYALTGADAASFSINSSTGAVTFVSSPDFETKSSYSINVKASDASGANNVQAVTINVTDVAPTITSATTATVAEGTSTATTVYTASATDPAGGTVTYALTGTDAASFSINAATGAVKFVASPDFETKSSYSINVKASDPSGANNVQAVTINVTDVAPTITSATTATVAEGTSTATVVYTAAGTDVNGGAVTYALTGTDAASFSINSSTGAVTFVSSPDFETKTSYSINVKASDPSGANNVQAVTINVTDVAPTITSATTATVAEGTSTATVVYTAAATDVNGGAVTYSLTGADAASFSVNSATGAVTFVSSPDFETKSSYSINVKASDPSGAFNTQAVTVNVTDVAPTITSSTTATVAEGTSTATVVYTAAATDVAGGTVTYALTGTDAASFNINSATGAVTFVSSPDFETKSSYSINIKASDPSGAFNTQAVTVNVTDVAPTISSSTTATVAEGTSTATVVYTAAATDVNGGTVTYALTGADAASFSINSATGAVTFVSSPDFETKSSYSINVKASDPSGAFNTQAVTVNVTDVAPTISSSTTATVAEGTSTATVVYTAAATDVNGGTVTYALTGTDAASFSINSATGAVTFVSSPDFETKSSYSINVKASDASGANNVQAVTINVTDVAPTITSATTATVAEGTSTATTVYTASATDPAGGTVTYALTGTDAASFSINAATGAVKFVASPDFETKSSYSINVKASDPSGANNVQAVTINVTDVAPTITSSTTATVAEGTSTATVVYTAAGTDVNGGTVTYALTGADAASFSINSATGAVTFVSSPDFETKSSYSINVKASDPSGAFNTQAVTVNVTDVAPTISSSTTATVAEGTSTATVVYTAAATDVNGGTVTYALTGADAASFNINSSTGAVTFVSSPDFETKSSYSINVKASDASGANNVQAVTINVTDVAPTITSATTATVAEGTSTATVVYTAAGTDVNGGTVTYALTGADAASFSINSATGAVTFVSSPDFETKSSYSINVKASDPSGAFNTQAVTVNVTDVAPTISSGAAGSVTEGAAAGTTVYSAAASDVVGGTVTYALTGADAGSFTINSSTGVVTINAIPDFETKSSYSFNVKASDPSGAFSTQAVTVNVTDVAPTISSSTTATVAEGTSTATVVYTAAATDVAGGTVTYALTGTDAASFNINSATGAVTFVSSPDFETKSSYSINIKASDPSGAFNTQAVTVNVTDVAPTISSSTTATVAEGTSTATVVYTAAATDVNGGAVTYALTGTDAASFSINSATGAVTFVSSPDFETKSSYSINVKASDASGAFNTQAVTVNVTDVAPTISSSTTATVAEGTSTATVVYTAAATDVNGGAVTYALTGTDAASFSINSATGAVTFVSSPDFETKSSYSINVKASDASGANNVQAVTINVTDVAPTITSATTATVAEGTSTATTVYTASATDPAGGTVTYALTGTDAASFSINAATGAVKFVASPDFETKSSYSINVKASDPSGANNVQAVTINVTDVAPTITSATTATVAEGTSTATVVYTAAGTDVNGGAVTYALTGTDAASFSINSATGAVTFVSSPDFETKSSYSINVKASDPSGAFNTQAVTVNVTDVAPTISSSTTATVAEGTSTATVVYTAAATDVNGGTVTYALTGADAASFNINSSTGAVTFVSSPDFETKSSYSINVKASDASGANNVQAVTINVTDVAPTITSATTATVAEGTSTATVVYTAAGTDVNGGTVTYALTGADAASFNINSATGAVTFVSSPDFETKSSYSINVKASDPSGAFNTQAVTVNVTDVAPTISSSTTATVAEGTSTATVVYTAAATDVNGGAVTYALTGTDAASFSINSATGAVTFVSSPDFETKSSYSINVKASDASGANNVQAVTINVTDVAPTITSATTATVAEGTSTATVVYTAAATDVNGGAVTYALTGADAASFSVNSATGAVTFVSSPDFETKSSYSFNVKASDASGANNVQAVTINVTDVAPTITSSTTATVAEGTSTAAVVYTASATDPVGGTVTYALTGADAASFSINSSTGAVTFVSSPDFETKSSYSINVKASDPSGANNVQAVTINVTDVAPTITSSTTATVVEGASTATVVYTASATDPAGGTVTYSLTGVDAASFNINSSTGAVTLVSSPDFETKSSYSINVKASDPSGANNVQAVTINVTDVAPMISSSTTATVAEGTSTATVVYTAAATDVNGGTVTYALTGADAASFNINSSTGAVTFVSSPDFETKSSYSINVKASDASGANNVQAVTINVTDVAPTISSSTTATVAEGTSTATVVYTAAATDVNGGAVTYSLTGADAASFNINSATGAVTFISSPDFETKSSYSINIKASDPSGANNVQAVTINVTDVAPTITSSTTATVAENTSTATVVYTAAATDVGGGTVTYSLTGTDAASFNINSATGAVTFVSSPDFETKSSYSINIKASDPSGANNVQAVTINITNVNEAPSGANATVAILENTTYTFASTDFGFSDPDAGDTLTTVRIDSIPGAGTLTLAGSGAVVAGQVVTRADIDAGKLQFTPVLNGSGAGYASVGFSVSDGTLFDAAPNTVTIDVGWINHAPTITSGTAVAVPEGIATSTVVYAGTATDLDGDTITWSLSGADAAAFTVNAATGAVKFNTSPDFETKSAYSFNVVASDGTITSSQAVTVSVSDVAPTITSATSVSVPEGTSAATVVYTAAATDVQGGAVSFSLGGADAAAFTINAATGAVSFNASPDFETKSAYSFNVVASDGTLTSSQAVTVSVSDVAPTITSATSVSVPEGTSAATVVYTAAATDVQGGAVSFSLGGADAAAFTINAATGAVTFNASPDFETKSAYSFNVVASDGTLTSSQAVTVSVTDVAPSITSATTVSVPEGTSAATVVYTAAATDVQGGAVSFSLSGADAAAFTINAATGAVTFNASPDFETKSAYSFNVVASDGTMTSSQAVTVSVTDVAPTITSTTSVSVPEGTSTATVVYTAAANDVQGGAVSFSLGGADAAAFTINAATGAVTFNASPDYETKSAYSFNVVASDGTMTSSQAVTVSVTDVAPTITSATSVSVPEGTSTATVVYTAAANDVQGGAVSFSLTGADAAAFSINAATGAVSFNASPDFETKSAYTFNVVASDGTITSSQAVTVAITDVAPSITSTTSVSVPEGTSTATVVYSAAATDVQGGAVTFSLGGADAAAFSIDATTGAVTFNTAPDFETKSAYSVNVMASDGTLTSSQAVTISVTDVAPVITSATSVSVPEGTTTTAVIYTASATDVQGGAVSFSLTGADAGAFSINAATGQVTFNTSPDFETKSAYSFNVVASDGTMTNSQAVTVSVTDVAPTVTSATSVSVPEGTSAATVVYTAAATDVQGGAVSFSLGGADAAAFTINAATGAVTFNASPDFETKSGYSFNVVANDGTISSSQAVTLSVTDVAPTITSASSITVPEGTSTATVVYTAAATDVQGGAVSFSLSGADAAAFTINAATGAVTFNASPDFETKSAYNFNVVASDGTISSSQAVTVSVSDVAPAITSTTSVSVPEGTSAATVVYTAAATDVQGGAVSFSLGGADAAAFTINAATGAVTFNASPDFETKSAYSFNVVASDGTLTSSQAVTVSVTDVAPTITSATTVSVPENTSTATVVYTATATDVQGGAVSFSLTGADAGAFTINAATGAVTFNASPDFETKGAYTFNVVANDGTISSSQAVTVSIADINEAPTGGNGTVSTLENTAYVFSAVDFGFADPDAGNTMTAVRIDALPAAGTLTLSGSGAVAAGQLITRADIDAGKLQFVPALNGSGAAYASLDFSVRDAVLFDASPNTLTIDVGWVDHAPSITSSTSVAVAEGIATTTVVYTASGTDIDAGDTITWNLAGADAGAFTIDSVTGAVTFNSSPDFETKSSYTFNVVASDGTLSTSQAVTVSVTDIAPTITSATSLSVPEGTSTATVVYTAAATDPAGGAVSFSLTGADASAFSINTATGAVTFNSSPDFETKSAYTFNVVASDGTASNAQAVTVSVTDVAPTITSATSVSVPEGTGTATVVYTAAASDVQGGAVSFSLTGADAAAFTVNAATGAVKFNTSPDFETKSAYSFNVVASDGTITSSQAVTVSVSDVAPTITSATSVSVPEGTSAATVVYTAAATDVQGGAVSFSLGGADAAAFTINAATGAVSFNASPDFETKSAYSFNVVASDGTLTSSQAVTVSVSDVAPTITSATSVSVPEGTSAATVVYTAAATDVQGGAVSFSLGGADAAAFTINAATGAVTFNASPDFETKSAYSFNVVASDGTLTSSQAVTVSVTDVAPSITSATTVSVPEGTSAATVVYTAAATDVQGGAVSFSLSGADAAAFTINAATGAVTFNASPDFETKSAYSFNVVASDGTMTSSQAVTVSVTDVAPTITSTTSVSVPEGTSTATVVYTAAANDVQGGAVSFSLGGADAAAFTINAATGAVTFNASPDYETKSAYSFNVVASDGTMTSSQAVTVSVTDVAPTITSATSVSVPEGTSTATVVYTAAANDVQGGAVSFSLTGADAAAFSINAATGAVSFNASPDFETKSAYTFNVVASDGTITSSQAVTVSITNVNEAPAVTSAASASFTENTTGAVYAATGSDPDAGDTIVWTISGPDAALFAINPATGSVSVLAAHTVSSPGDANADGVYDITLTATDSGGLATSKTVQLTLAPTGTFPATTAQPGTPQQPDIIVNVAPPSSATAPIVASSPTPMLPAGTPAGDPSFGLLPLGQPVDRTVDRSSLGSSAGAAPSLADRALSMPDLNALPATAAGPQDLSGFPVQRVSLAEAIRVSDTGSAFMLGGQRLFVYHGIPDMQLLSDGSGAVRIPQDAFAHTDPSAIVTLEARYANGLPLPSWLKFEGTGGTFRGLPPEGLRGSLDIEVIARDAEGREAQTRFSLEIADLQTAAGRPADLPDLPLGLDVDAKEKEKARVEAARQAAQRGDPVKGKAGADAKGGKQPSASFTDQLKVARAPRDPLLDRITGQGSNTPRDRR